MRQLPIERQGEASCAVRREAQRHAALMERRLQPSFSTCSRISSECALSMARAMLLFPKGETADSPGLPTEKAQRRAATLGYHKRKFPNPVGFELNRTFRCKDKK